MWNLLLLGHCDWISQQGFEAILWLQPLEEGFALPASLDDDNGDSTSIGTLPIWFLHEMRGLFFLTNSFHETVRSAPSFVTPSLQDRHDTSAALDGIRWHLQHPTQDEYGWQHFAMAGHYLCSALFYDSASGRAARERFQDHNTTTGVGTSTLPSK